MKTWVVPFLAQVNRHASAEKLLAALMPVNAIDIATVPWSSYPYRPLVQCKIAHAIDGMVLCYDVKEKHIQATYRNTNDPVYKDSCVEFFLSFDKATYYNLEFNCLGTALIGYGNATKSERQLLPQATIEQVKCYSYVNADTGDNGETEWRLLLYIPFTVFEAHHISSLAGVRCTGNFYKCGDELPEPHFVAWNGIDHPTPNFHLPQFFGELRFQ